MATLYVTELYVNYAAGRLNLVAPMPPAAEQTLAIGGASVASAQFTANTNLIRVHADAICSIAVGSGTPTATTSQFRMAAGQTEYLSVAAGSKIAVITNT